MIENWLLKPKKKADNKPLLNTLNETKENFSKRCEFLQAEVEKAQQEAVSLRMQNKANSLCILKVLF